jgi:hypothetical protein
LKNDVNVPSKSNKKKKKKFYLFFVGVLKVNDENSRIMDSLVRDMDPRIQIRIHIKRSWIRNAGLKVHGYLSIVRLVLLPRALGELELGWALQRVRLLPAALLCLAKQNINISIKRLRYVMFSALLPDPDPKILNYGSLLFINDLKNLRKKVQYFHIKWFFSGTYRYLTKKFFHGAQKCLGSIRIRPVPDLI